MENDYLWDKSGEDKEIEDLENALKGFRYQPISAPILPVKVLQIEEKPKFSFFGNYFRLALAGFACLVILFAGFSIFLKVSKNKIEDVADLSKPIITTVQIPNEQIFEPKLVKQEKQATQKVVRAVETKQIQPKSAIVSKPTQIVFRQTERPKVKPIKEIELTDEEKYAYSQLMLALSITGEKLKEVKDKANSVEDSTPIKSTK